MNEADTELAFILADCVTDDDLARYIMKHAIIVQQLVCEMAKGIDQNESGIRLLYSTFADMTVAQHLVPCVVADKVLH